MRDDDIDFNVAVVAGERDDVDALTALLRRRPALVTSRDASGRTLLHRAAADNVGAPR